MQCSGKALDLLTEGCGFESTTGTKHFRDFPQSLKANAEIIIFKQAKTTSFQITNHDYLAIQLDSIKSMQVKLCFM